MKLRTIALSLAAIAGLSFSMTSCNKDDNPTITNTPVSLSASMSGANEKPTSTSSTATGTFMGTLNESTRTLSYTVTYSSGFTPTAGHLHRITDPTSMTGGVAIGFPSLTSPIMGTAVLGNQNLVDSMKNGYYYANLHTAQLPAGAIRGDVKRQ